MLLTLAQIRTFRAIVRLGSFHAAAQALNLTQPSVSQRVRELELALGTELFIRRGPRVSLTAEGHALIDHAERLLESADGIMARFRGNNPLQGTLRIGLNESFALVCLPELLRRLRESYPNLQTAVHVGDTAAVSRLLNDRKLDVGIVSHPDLEPYVGAQFIGTNDFGWIARVDLPVPPGVLSPADLGRLHLTISPDSARLHATASAWFARAGVSPPRLSTCNNLSVTRLTILNGVATGLVPLRVMQDELARGEVKIVPVAPPIPGHRVSLCYQASEFGPSLQQILDLIRTLVQEYQLFSASPDDPAAGKDAPLALSAD